MEQHLQKGQGRKQRRCKAGRLLSMHSLQLPWAGQQQLECKRTAGAALACDIAAARADPAADFKTCSSLSQGA